jgi:hypothetical protein
LNGRKEKKIIKKDKCSFTPISMLATRTVLSMYRRQYHMLSLSQVDMCRNGIFTLEQDGAENFEDVRELRQ